MHSALFTCLYSTRFLLIQGSPAIPDALEVSCAYYYSTMFLLNFKNHSLSAAVSFSARAPVGVCFMISCIMISACISIHSLCIISLSNIYPYASLCCHCGWYLWILFWANFSNLLITCAKTFSVNDIAHWTDSSIRLDKYKMQFGVRKAKTESIMFKLQRIILVPFETW